MWNVDRNCFVITAFTIIVVIISILSLDLVFSTDNQQFIVNSFQKLVKIDDYCRPRNGNFSTDSAKACNCSACGSESRPPSPPGFPFPPPPPCPAPNTTVIVKEKVIKKPCQTKAPWYAIDTLWHYPTMFPRCSMDVCFNYSRCENMDDIRIFSYNIPGPPARYFGVLNSSKSATTDPNEACLFMAYLDTANPWAPHPGTLPFWNAGMNHVLVTFHDRWALTKVAMDSIGFASLLISDMHETVYRPGFDISIPLPPKVRLTQFQQHKAFHRKYFLTFRGLRYLGHANLEGVFRSHDTFRNMHNGEDIIVAVSCRHPTNNYVRQKEPALGANCDEDKENYDKYNYADLMNSTFALAPAGRQPNSYRFMEILSAGTIPVLIADNYVKPFDTLIQWHRCILQFPTKQMHRIVPILRRVGKEEAEERQKYCLKVYWEFLKDDETLVRSAVISLKARMMGFFPNLMVNKTI